MTRSVRSCRGFALTWALVLLVLVGGLSTVIVSRLTSMRQAAAVDEADAQAMLSADGAIATARATLVADPSWPGGGVNVGPLLVATTVVRAADGWTVTARAGGSVVVEASLQPDGDRVPRIAAWRRVR
jgi:type II secretory pathway pseudopilin PulG